jgi:hypothetical protein
MKKIVILCSLMLIISGCSVGKFSSDYKKIKASDDKIDSYTLNLRIYGIYNNDKINKNMRIESYKNNQYMITIFNNTKKSIDRKNNEIDNNELEQANDEIIYVVNKKTYVVNKTGEYIESKGDVRYDNPSIYLSGLNHISKINKVAKETIGTNKYDVYDVNFSKKSVMTILKDTTYSDIKISDNVTGQIYIDQNGYIYRIIYNIEGVTINANYNVKDLNKPINLPNEIKEDAKL